jgi:hypothetical protein
VALRAEASASRPLLLDDRADELFVSPVQTATRQALDAHDTVVHLRRLQEQSAAAEHGRRLAQAQLLRLRGERDAAVLEVPSNLAKRLQILDAKIAEQTEQHASFTADVTTLGAEIDQLLAEADTLIDPVVCQEMDTARRDYEQRRAAVIGRIETALAPLLTELVVLENAIQSTYPLRQQILAQMKQHLRRLEPAAEPAPETTATT